MPLSRFDDYNNATQSEQKDLAMLAIGQGEAYTFLMGCTMDKAVQLKKNCKMIIQKGKTIAPSVLMKLLK